MEELPRKDTEEGHTLYFSGEEGHTLYFSGEEGHTLYFSGEEGHTLYFSGEEKQHKFGFGFLVHKNIKDTVLRCYPVSSRLTSIRRRKATQIWFRFSCT